MNEIATQGRSGGLDERQRKLVEALSAGFDGSPVPSDADLAALAGYAAAGHVVEATRSDAVQGELKTRRVARIKGTLAAKAMQTIETLLDSDKTPAATRFSAAKWVLEQAGHTESQADDAAKPMAQMSEQELEAFMVRAQKVIDAGGEPPTITVTP